MSTRPVRPIQNPIETLQRILQHTTLTTQQATHVNISDVGGNIYGSTTEAFRLEKLNAVKKAIADTQERATKELKEALRLAREEADKNLKNSLEDAKRAAQEQALRMACARDILEGERIKKLTVRMKREKEEALQSQWEECEKMRMKAVADAIAETTQRLHNQFALEKELAVAEALRVAREKFEIRLENAIESMRIECERVAAAEAARIAKLHQQECDRLEDIIDDLRRRLRDEIEARNLVQSDFRALQRDYKRFMDFTDGKYHSDYLLKLRKHGMKYDRNWDRRDSEEVTMFPIPTVLAHCRRQNGLEETEKPKTLSFAPIK
ncbi:uncharacterized protein LOC117101547 [Anneissia japonica]|uniref:uncharacterized protein LOC117101547 n=1 Tax=Anneissia japonica TaxID=1529436 RepID=UPI001425B790|nr:uncharacterized protein LOC117101547 [Anneissia japonica]